MNDYLKKIFCYMIFIFKYKPLKILIKFSAIFIQSSFEKYAKLYENSKVINSSIGMMSYIGQRTIVVNAKIGRFCSIAPDVKIGLGKHPTHFISTHPAFFSVQMQSPLTFVGDDLYEEFQSISIGNDVWIGANAVILDGITIGNGVIIGAGAVVTKDIPDYAIAVGVPAKVVKYRFDEKNIQRLNDFRWWDKDLNFLRKNAKKFQSIDCFQDFL